MTPPSRLGRPACRSWTGCSSAGLRLIVAYKAIKALMEGAVAVALWIAVGAGLAARADALVMGLADHTVHPALVRLASWVARWTRPDDLRRLALLLGADAVMTAVEGWVLQRGYRWGPWLVVGTTAALLPFEVVDLVQRPRAGLAVIFAINLAIVAYLAHLAGRGRHERSLARA